MADAKKYYWLKLKRDFFKRHDIRIVESMPNGKDYILFYLKLLLESIDHEGTLRFSDTIPYNEQMLSVVTNTNIDIVRSAMKLFIELNMMQVFDDQTIYMTEVDKLIGSETKWAEYKRNKKVTDNDLPQLNVCKRLSYESIQLPNGKVQYVDEKRYGCNGGLAFDRSGGKCEICGSEENLLIHHNNGYSNELEDLLICCKKCHGKLEKVQSKSKLLPTEIEKDKDIDKDIEIESDVVGEQDSPTTTDNSLKPIGGKLGRGLVMLTDSQFDDLMDRLSNAEIDTYISKMADMIEKGYTFRCSHYQYILKMVEEDRRTR